jgi:hypothetical protein
VPSRAASCASIVAIFAGRTIDGAGQPGAVEIGDHDITRPPVMRRAGDHRQP